DKKIGFIENGFIDFKSRRLVSIIVSDGRLFPKLCIVPLKNIVYDKNRIYMSGPECHIKRKIYNRNIRFTIEGMIGRDVTNNDGKIIGEVEDVILNHLSGELKAIICKRGFYDDLIRGKKVMLINEGLIIREDRVIVSKSSIEMVCVMSFKNDFEEVEG
ncbi:MAG: PRC-barrel domain-containing protein, partial [Clostridium sp.]